MFDQERGFEMGGGGGICHPFNGIFLTYMLWTYSPHTDISHVGGTLGLRPFIFIIMLYLVRKPDVYSADARKEGKLKVQSGDLVIPHDTLSGRFVPETFRHRTFYPKHAKCSSLDVSSHNS